MKDWWRLRDPEAFDSVLLTARQLLFSKHWCCVTTAVVTWHLSMLHDHSSCCEAPAIDMQWNSLNPCENFCCRARSAKAARMLSPDCHMTTETHIQDWKSHFWIALFARSFKNWSMTNIADKTWWVLLRNGAEGTGANSVGPPRWCSRGKAQGHFRRLHCWRKLSSLVLRLNQFTGTCRPVDLQAILQTTTDNAKFRFNPAHTHEIFAVLPQHSNHVSPLRDIQRLNQWNQRIARNVRHCRTETEPIAYIVGQSTFLACVEPEQTVQWIGQGTVRWTDSSMIWEQCFVWYD